MIVPVAGDRLRSSTVFCRVFKNFGFDGAEEVDKGFHVEMLAGLSLNRRGGHAEVETEVLVAVFAGAEGQPVDLSDAQSSLFLATSPISLNFISTEKSLINSEKPNLVSFWMEYAGFSGGTRVESRDAGANGKVYPRGRR